MTDYKQAPPFCVQIELTEGCNLRCSFCGLNGIRGKENNYKFMTLETAEQVASSMAEHGWNSRLEFAMHGEPTMNPEVLEILKVFRKYLPKAYMLMETNGGGLLKDPVKMVDDLFEAGLTTLAFDEYTQVKLVPKIFAKLRNHYNSLDSDNDWDFDDSRKIFGATVYEYPNCGPVGNPHQRRPLSKKRIVWIKPIDVSTSGTHANLNNHAGAGAPPNNKADGKRCEKPFREMSVRWDGGVAVCCNDWRGVLPIGNTKKQSVDDIWHDPIFYAARRKLYAAHRDFGACRGCDSAGHRLGLLPDLKGQHELEAPSEKDDEILRRAIRKGPLTKPVQRPWEQE